VFFLQQIWWGCHFSDHFTRIISPPIFVTKVIMAHPRIDGIPQLQLALALTILKSKPIEYSTRGGCLQHSFYWPQQLTEASRVHQQTPSTMPSWREKRKSSIPWCCGSLERTFQRFPGRNPEPPKKTCTPWARNWDAQEYKYSYRNFRAPRKYSLKTKTNFKRWAQFTTG